MYIKPDEYLWHYIVGWNSNTFKSKAYVHNFSRIHFNYIFLSRIVISLVCPLICPCKDTYQNIPSIKVDIKHATSIYNYHIVEDSYMWHLGSKILLIQGVKVVYIYTQYVGLFLKFTNICRSLYHLSENLLKSIYSIMYCCIKI